MIAGGSYSFREQASSQIDRESLARRRVGVECVFAGTGITVSNTASEANAIMLALVAERRGECCLAPDICFCHVTAATVGRTARQPECGEAAPGDAPGVKARTSALEH